MRILICIDPAVLCLCFRVLVAASVVVASLVIAL